MLVDYFMIIIIYFYYNYNYNYYYYYYYYYYYLCYVQVNLVLLVSRKNPLEWVILLVTNGYKVWLSVKSQERKLFVVFLQFLVMRSSTRFLELNLYQYPEVTYSDL